MDGELRKTGIGVLGDVPWGTHFCQFYETAQDLIDILVPYFQAGLESGEFCMWVTAEPLTEKQAEAALREAMPDLDGYLANGQIEIIPYTDWYLKGGSFDQGRVLQGWVDKLEAARRRGFQGLRLTGNTFWLEKSDWDGFTAYEEAVNGVIGNYRMIAICTYSVDKCRVSEVADVISNHEFALIKRGGDWSIIASAEHKQTKDRLQAANDRLNRSQEIAHLGSWELDLVKDELSWSDEVYRIFGLRPQEFGATYEAFLDAVHPDDRAAVDAAYSGSVREGKSSYEIEHRVVRKATGEVRWVHEKCHHVRDETGKIVSSLGMVLDITERKQSEERLRDMAQRLDSHMQNSPLAVVEWDSDHRVVRWSEEAEYVFGWSAEEMLGKRIDEVRWVYEEDWDQVAKLMEDMHSGVRPRNVNPSRNYRKDGSVIWCEWYNSVLRDEAGDTTSVLSLVLDVTDREMAARYLAEARAEAERRAAELESLIQNMGDGVAFFSADGSIVLSNAAAVRMVGAAAGLPAEEWLTACQVRSLDGEPVPTDERPLFKALRGEQTAETVCRHLSAAGERVLSVTATTVRDAADRIAGAVLIFRDVRERVEFERQREEIYLREHHIAEVLQQALIPQQSYDLPGWNVVARYQPALEEARVGGDFYDVFDLGDGRAGILMGDVAGKGLQAAMKVASVRYAIRSYAYLDPDPARVMALVNQAILRDSPEGENLMTAFFGVLDTRDGTLRYASAGHEPPIVIGPGGKWQDLGHPNAALGFLEAVAYTESRAVIGPGDILLLITDGVTEAKSPERLLFGKDRVIAWLREHYGAAPEQIADGLLEAARSYAGGSLADDAAVLAFGMAAADNRALAVAG